MIAAFYGRVSTLREHRAKFRGSQRGATLAELRTHAEECGFHCRGVRVDLASVAKLVRPAILHWDMTHFVVLEAVGRNNVRIVDPALGRQKLRFTEFGQHFTGVAMELAPSVGFSRSRPHEGVRLRDFVPAFRGLGGSLAATVLMTVALQVLTLAAPLNVQFTVDQGVGQSDAGTVVAVAVGFALVALAAVLAEWLRTLTVVHIGNLSSFRIVAGLARRLLRLPDAWFVEHHAGDVMSRFDSTHPIRQFLMTGAFTILVDGAISIGALAVLVVYSPGLGAVAMAFLTADLALRYGTAGRLAGLTNEMIVATARERSAFIENLQRQRVIKLLGIETDRGDAWEARYVSSINANATQARFVAHVDLAANVLRQLEPIVILALGALKVIEGSFTLGMLFAFIVYAGLLSDRARSTVALIVELRLLGVHKGRVAEIALEEPESMSEGKDELHLQGALTARDVSFSYGRFSPPVLENFCLRVEPGEFVAIQGASGTGKSTLIKLLCGLIQPQQGEVRADGVPFRQLDLRWYRSQLGVVMQDDDLFTGTLAENIGLENSNDLDRIKEAARLACIHDDIEGLPMGYRTLVGYMGAALSGGQRQRVMLARALFRKPAVLILDEGTAHLDGEVKQRVLSNVRSSGATVIFATHDDEVVAAADRRVAFDELAVRSGQ